MEWITLSSASGECFLRRTIEFFLLFFHAHKLAQLGESTGREMISPS